MGEHDFLKLQQRVSWHVNGTRDLANFPDDLDEIKDALNGAVMELFNDSRMAIFRQELEVVLTNGEPIYTIGETDDTKVISVVSRTVYFEDNPNCPICYETEQDWVQAGGNALGNGRPLAWTSLGYDADEKLITIKFKPTPGASEDGKVVKFQGYVEPLDMSANTDVPPIPSNLHEYLIHGAIVGSFLEFIDDRDKRALHVRRWEEGKKAARKTVGTPVTGQINRMNSTRFPNRGSFMDRVIASQ